MRCIATSAEGQVTCFSVYAQLFVCTLGFVLNFCCVCIFCRVSRTSFYRNITTVNYLIALCAMDSLQLTISVPTAIGWALTSTGAFDKQHANIEMIVAYGVRYLTAVLLTASYSSIWIITIMCAQRYGAVRYPGLRGSSKAGLRWLRRSGLNILLVILLFFLVNLPKYFQYQIVENIAVANDPNGLTSGENGTIGSISARNLSNVLVWSNRTQSAYQVYYTAFGSSKVTKAVDSVIYVCFLYVAPFILLLILNFKILTAIRQEKVRPKTSEDSYDKKERRIAYMILTIAVLFLILHTLAAASRLFDLFGAKKSFIMHDISNLLMNLNSALNPLVYFSFTNRFHDLFFNIRNGSSAGKHQHLMIVDNTDCQMTSTEGPDDIRRLSGIEFHERRLLSTSIDH